MDKQRRNFLKVAGISTLAGLGAPVVVDRLLTGGEAHASGHGEAQSQTHAGEHEAAHEEVKSGNRYGLVIDTIKFNNNPGLDQKCADRCHHEHNVPDFGDENKKDEIKWIWPTPYGNAFPDESQLYLSTAVTENKVLVLCNHCDNPPCVRACPTKATFKNKDGMVIMDFHRCIGCRFCMAACPYGARSFNWRDPRWGLPTPPPNPRFPTRMRGVVEKCNFCAERIAEGKQPACVEAANEVAPGAMVFGNLNDPNSEIRKILKENYTIQRKPSLGTHPSVFYIV